MKVLCRLATTAWVMRVALLLDALDVLGPRGRLVEVIDHLQQGLAAGDRLAPLLLEVIEVRRLSRKQAHEDTSQPVRPGMKPRKAPRRHEAPGGFRRPGG